MTWLQLAEEIFLAAGGIFVAVSATILIVSGLDDLVDPQPRAPRKNRRKS
jgi:hypothetical protein